MQFLNPWIFALGAGLVSVPIIIHLLNRRRYRTRDWAAMQFLLESVRKNRRRLRIEELILLALRCLMILLLAGVIGRMSCSRPGALPGGDAPVSVVYVLDDSYSMGQKIANSTLFSLASGDLAEMVRRQRGGRQTILLASEPDANRAVFRPAEGVAMDPNRLAERIQALKPGHRRARLDEALDTALGLLADVKGPKRLTVLSDFRSADFDAADPAERLAPLRKKMRDQKIELVAMDYGRPARNNLTVESVELLDRFATVGSPARLRATVRNNGPAPSGAIKLVVTAGVDGQDGAVELKLPAVKVDSIAPGQSGRAEFRYVPRQAGPLRLTASVSGDELPADDDAHLVLDVREAIRLLVLDGEPDLTDPQESESFFLVQALDPRQDGRFGVAVDVRTYEGLPDVRFADYDAVAMLNFATFPTAGATPTEPYPQLEALRRYVRQGGGLIWFAGDRVDSTFHNEFLWRQGKGMAPYRLLAATGGDPGGREFFRLDPGSLRTSSFLGIFAGKGSVLSGLIRFWKFLRVDEAAAGATPDHAGSPRVLARFADPQASPAVAERRFGEGAVVAFYSSASDEWNDWPSDPVGTYVLVLRDAVQYVARARGARAERVGAPIVHRLPPAEATSTAALRRPDFPAEPEVTLRPVQEGPHAVLEYGRTDRMGVYQLTVTSATGRTDRTVFVRNGDPAEGRLAPAGREGLADALGDDAFVYRRMGESGSAASTADARPSRELWPWLIAVLLAMAALEVFLGQRFGHYGNLKDKPSAEVGGPDFRRRM